MYVNSAAYGKEMSDLSVRVLLFAGFAVHHGPEKILLVRPCSSLPSSFNMKNIFLAFAFQQMCLLLEASTESLGL